MTNHLIIGLGGTGGRIIRSFKKTLYMEFRKDRPEDVNIDYLYIDTSGEMMKLDDPSWKILGHSVQLGENQRMHVEGRNLIEILDVVDNYPGIKPWIGDRKAWREIIGGIVGDTIGGQKRRLGRFLFSTRAGDFINKLHARVRDITLGSDAAVTFHVCFGMAGGTGSGTVIDVISQIRNHYNDSQNYRIILYAFLPEKDPKPKWDTGNYHANGFAALLELNAMSIGAMLPHDIAGDGKPLNITDPFNGCYLFTDTNQNGLRIDTEKDLPNVVADFLFQKIVNARGADWESLRRAENGENFYGGIPEMSEHADTIPARSKRFLAFGVKRIAIPQEEIAEKLTYAFAVQAARQVRYNNWSDFEGFLDEGRNQDFGGFVKQKEQLEKWLLTEEHLILSLGILQSDIQGKWRLIKPYWNTSITAFKDEVRQKNKKTWFDQLEIKAEARFAEQYRGEGVKNFYKTASSAKRDRAREIRRRLERELFDDWKNSTRSMQEIAQLLSAILGSLHERHSKVPDMVAQHRERMERADAEVKRIKKDASNAGIIRDFLKRDKMLDAFALELQSRYVNATYVEGWNFAGQFLPDIIEELTDLKANVDEAASMINESIEEFKRAFGARCTDDPSKSDLRQQVIRFYDRGIVDSVVKRLCTNKQEQETQTQRVRQALCGRLGEKQTFSNFNEKIHKGVFIDILEARCEENMRIAHQNLIDNDREKLLNVNIVERLAKQYGGDQQGLRKYIDGVVKAAGTYLTFNQSQKTSAATNIDQKVIICADTFVVFIPNTPDQKPFVDKLKEAITASLSSGTPEFFDNVHKNNEIIFINIINPFPLRVVDQVLFLRDKYLKRTTGGGAKARLEVHTSGDGSDLPVLFPMDKDEIEGQKLQYVLFARALGIIQERDNAAGVKEMAIPVIKYFGGVATEDQPIFLGKGIHDAAEKLSLEDFFKMKADIDRRLENPEFRLQKTKDETKEAIAAAVNDLKALVGLNSDTYKKYYAAANEAIARIS
jgi:hypothetical protein